jgi:phosphosulfolactate synthase (CoM biosynthesis protein A)
VAGFLLAPGMPPTFVRSTTAIAGNYVVFIHVAVDRKTEFR